MTCSGAIYTHCHEAYMSRLARKWHLPIALLVSGGLLYGGSYGLLYWAVVRSDTPLAVELVTEPDGWYYRPITEEPVDERPLHRITETQYATRKGMSSVASFVRALGEMLLFVGLILAVYRALSRTDRQWARFLWYGPLWGPLLGQNPPGYKPPREGDRRYNRRRTYPRKDEFDSPLEAPPAMDSDESAEPDRPC